MTLLLRDGRLVLNHGMVKGDLVVEDGVITAILPDNDGRMALPEHVMNCHGRLVLPGGIDVHVHSNTPGNRQREDLTSLTRAALAGGITSIVDMPIDSLPPPVDAESFSQKRTVAEGACLVDYALWGGFTGGDSADMLALGRQGAAGFKAFMVAAGDDYPHVMDEDLRRAFRVAATMSRPVLVHAEDPVATAVKEASCRRTGRIGVADFLQARSETAENSAVAKALALAAREDCHVHICHASGPRAVDLVAASRRRAERVSVETCMHYLLLDEDDLHAHPNELKCMPPLRSRESREALWLRLLDGDIDIIASDHSPCEPWEKAPDRSIWDAWGGLGSVQATYRLLFSEGVVKRGLLSGQFVELIAANPARLAGLYPRKGTIQVGSDADLVIMDPNRSWTLTERDLLTKHAACPYVGMSGYGAIDTVLLRGVVAFDHDTILAEPGFGRFYGRF